MTETKTSQRGNGFKDLLGKRFARLTVISHAGRVKRKTRWLCVCECGNEIETTADSLQRGDAKSCGCLHREAVGTAARTHGRSGTPEHSIWKAMIRRCYNQNVKEYFRYGGRGIVVCERWRSFENFLADMGERPSAEHSIDRKDNNGNYEPGNCRWATRKQQGRNKRNNYLLTVNGVTKTLPEWAEITGKPYVLLQQRFLKGWPHERIVNEPSRASY